MYVFVCLLQFFTLDGLNSGVPTKTTPTLTPTTLRNIEQTFIELQCEAESHQNEARFVPPLVHSIGKHCLHDSLHKKVPLSLLHYLLDYSLIANHTVLN